MKVDVLSLRIEQVILVGLLSACLALTASCSLRAPSYSKPFRFMRSQDDMWKEKIVADSRNGYIAR